MENMVPENNNSQHKPVSSIKNFLIELLKLAVLVVVVVIPFRIFIAQPFMVSGSSMNPTFNDRDYLIVNQIGLRLGELERYDVVIFKYPENPSKYFIKRIIGLPGERVVVNNDTATIYNDDYPEGLLVDSSYSTGETIGTADIELGEEEFFVLGDNRNNSSDSRFWGALPRENIVGTPLLRLFPITEAKLSPGAHFP